MIDSVLKGTGNSRFLKSAVPAGTSWADALAMLQAGTFPIDFNGINTDGFQQVGTPLNKANLLKDATAAQIGLPPSTTPDGMFQALGNTGELHVWRKTVASGTGTYSLGAVQEGLHYIKWANYATSDSSVGTLEYGSEVSVNNDGTITGIKNPSTITIKPWYDDVSKANVFKGKFIKMISQVETSMSSFKIGEIWWIPADATMTTGLVNGEGNTRYIAASKRQQVIGVPAGTTTTYPVSTNPNAYQAGEYGKAGYTLGDVKTGTFQIGQGATTIAANRAIIKYGASVSVTDTGTASIASESELTVTSDSSQSAVDKLKGKFFRFSQLPFSSSAFSAGKIYFFPANTVFTKQSSGNWSASKYQTVTSHGKTEPEYTIEYLGKLGDKARVQVVSYIGTGTYGSSNPCSLTFDFAPKVVMFLRGYKESSTQFNYLYGSYGSDSLVIISADLSNIFAVYNGFGRYNSAYAKKDLSGRTITWYSNEGSNSQANAFGVTHYFLAIG